MKTSLSIKSAIAASLLCLGISVSGNSASAAIIDVVQAVPQSGFSGFSTPPMPLTGPAGWVFAPPPAGATLIGVGVSLRLGDGDTAAGNFDVNDITLGLDGIDTGLLLNGFPNGSTVTISFPVQPVANLAAIQLALADNTLVGTLIDADPNDNTINIPNTFNTSLTLRFQVPEPGTLAILGLGLVGLGIARRRKVA